MDFDGLTKPVQVKRRRVVRVAPKSLAEVWEFSIPSASATNSIPSVFPLMLWNLQIVSLTATAAIAGEKENGYQVGRVPWHESEIKLITVAIGLRLLFELT